MMLFQAKLFFVALITMAVVVRGNTCGSNCPSNTCTTCYCGSTTNTVDIATWCAKYTWNQANCQCIMLHESGGNANAMHVNGDGGVDVGLWQINDYNWNACNNGQAPCDMTANLNCAIDVYNWGGQTWKFWATCGMCNACDKN